MQEKKSESSYAQVKSKIKVVFLGEQSTGKTSILMRFIHDKFEEGSGPTIGIDFMAKNLHVNNNILRMQLWDTAGQQRFRSLIPSYLKDALIAFIVFDLTNQKSFDNLNQWLELCQNNKKQKTVLVLLGNKADLEEQREVAEQTVKQKIQEIGLPYFEVSAKTGSNIKEAFHFAGSQYFNQNVATSHELTFSSVIHEKTRPATIPEVPEMASPTYKTGKKGKKQAESKMESKMIPVNSMKLNNTKEKNKKKGCC